MIGIESPVNAQRKAGYKNCIVAIKIVSDKPN